MLIDTHTHIYGEEYDSDRDAVVQRAIDAGVHMMLLPAIDSKTTQRQQTLQNASPTLFRSMTGVHPTSINDQNMNKELALVEQHLELHPHEYIAIGEIGLDLYWDTTYREQQEEALLRQMLMAERYHLPVSLHVRNAYTELFTLLNKMDRSSYQGVLHCYSGTLEQAHLAVEMGFVLGIGGVLTYKKSLLPDIVKEIGLEHIVLETDAPYLSPVPHRGKRNEPSYLPLVAHCVAEIKEVKYEEVASITSQTAIRVFNLN